MCIYIFIYMSFLCLYMVCVYIYVYIPCMYRETTKDRLKQPSTMYKEPTTNEVLDGAAKPNGNVKTWNIALKLFNTI